MKLFTYGILQSPDAQRARLHGMKKNTRGAHATIEPAPDDYVDGDLLDVDRDQLDSYDKIEGHKPDHPIESYYWRLPITEDVHVYVGNHLYDDAWTHTKTEMVEAVVNAELELLD